MPVKKSVATKKAAPKKKVMKATKKAVAAKKPALKTSKGDAYECGVCGLLVTVDETCGCADVCDIICCGKPMKIKKAKSASKKK
jgi:hypothetical protein